MAEVEVVPTSSVTLPSLTEASEVPNPEVQPPEAKASVARNGTGLPVLVAEDGEDAEDGEAMAAATTLLGRVEAEADCQVESVSPSLPRLAPEAPEVEAAEGPAATALPAPAPPCGIPEQGAAQVRKVSRQLIMAPEIRLPALSRRNRKNTVTWIMMVVMGL